MTPVDFIILSVLGLFIGFLSSFFGIGGGAFLVPALVYAAGLGWPEAIGLSLAQMVPTSAFGAWRRARAGEIRLRLAAWSLAGSLPGAVLGRSVVEFLEKQEALTIAGREIEVLNSGLSLIFVSLLAYNAIRMARPAGPALVPPAPEPPEDQPDAAPIDPANGERKFAPWEAAALGAGVGFTAALLGIGGGFLFVPIAVQCFGLPVAAAVGTSLLQMPVTAAFSAGLYLRTTEIPYTWLIPLILGAFIGVIQGTTFSRRFGNREYRRLLAGLFAVVAALVLFNWLREAL